MRPVGQKIIYNIGTSIASITLLICMVVSFVISPILGIIYLLFIVFFCLIFGLPYLRNKKSKKLLESGLRANGKIIEMWDTGVNVNNQPQIEMVIEVTPLNDVPFKSKIKLVISRLDTSYYQVGVNCIVRYAPDDKKTVAIESIGVL
jgi:hypothetical protein